MTAFNFFGHRVMLSFFPPCIQNLNSNANCMVLPCDLILPQTLSGKDQLNGGDFFSSYFGTLHRKKRYSSVSVTKFYLVFWPGIWPILSLTHSKALLCAIYLCGFSPAPPFCLPRSSSIIYIANILYRATHYFRSFDHHRDVFEARIDDF